MSGGVTLFALNRHLSEAMAVEVNASGFGALVLHDAQQMHDADLRAVNTKHDPERVKPMPLDNVTIASGRVRATLAPASWNVIRTGTKGG